MGLRGDLIGSKDYGTETMCGMLRVIDTDWLQADVVCYGLRFNVLWIFGP